MCIRDSPSSTPTDCKLLLRGELRVWRGRSDTSSRVYDASTERSNGGSAGVSYQWGSYFASQSVEDGFDSHPSILSSAQPGSVAGLLFRKTMRRVLGKGRF